MSELAEPLGRVLEATGYLRGGEPAASTVTILNGKDRRRRTFLPDVRWCGQANLNVYFKFAENPSNKEIGTWQQEVWNEGNVPLLWIVGPDSTALYNGFALPKRADNATENCLDTFHHGALNSSGLGEESPSGLTGLDARAGRLAMETGRFWEQESRVNRKSTVDRRLLQDMASLERVLVGAGLSIGNTQGLIGRSIFAKYLVDRGIITEERLREKCGRSALQDVFRDGVAAEKLFNWLSFEFNGDMFSSTDSIPDANHLQRVADFLDGDDMKTGQKSLFPYYFDLIPVELISAIYEQFVHSADAELQGTAAPQPDVYYTPIAAVSLVLDEVMQGLTGDETVLDITCGSGVFLVEALRRLTRSKAEKAGNNKPTRAMIREALYKQIYGVDISPAAVRIAAFSLYLAALELDPDPNQAPGMKFRPLVGKTLLVGDAHSIETTPEGKAALTAKTELKRFDVILGNPPWTYQGRHGTSARRERMPGRALSSRGVSFDFVDRAKDFAHDRTRFGVVVSAMPFFSRSARGRVAALNLVESLSPLTLINLSNHSSWLFPKANMPAMALIGRYRKQKADRMQLVQVPWSKTGPGSHTFEIAGGDVETLHLASWRRNPDLFKAAFFGKLHDHLLLEDLFEKQEPLKHRLAAFDTSLKMGLTFGNRAGDAGFLRELPLLKEGLQRLSMPKDLPIFGRERAEHPRQRKIYRAPLLVVQEFLRGGARPIVAVSEMDVVFTKAYFGVSFASRQADVAYLLAGILSSTFASWYFIMTGATFGLWKQRLLEGDVNALPTPDLNWALTTEPGIRITRLVRKLQGRPPRGGDWRALDEAVFDLYDLDEGERMVARDGLFRASWQWQEGRQESVAPAERVHLEGYAAAFVSKIDPWFHAASKRRIRAEIHEATRSDPLRLIRFVLEQHPPPSVIGVRPSDDLAHDVLAQISERLNISVEDDLTRFGELRLTDRDEVVIVKPSARRHWLAVNAFADARAVLEESFQGGPG